MKLRAGLAALTTIGALGVIAACGDEPRPPVVTERFPGPTVGGSQSDPTPAPTSTGDAGRTPALPEAGAATDGGGGTVLACACTLQLSNGSTVGLPCGAEVCDPPIFVVYACDSIARLSSRPVTGC